MTHQPRDKKNAGKLNEHPVRMTQHRSRCGISRFESFTGAFITLCVSAYTGLTGGFTEMDIHMQSGVVALALVAFRIGWGVLGSHYARFIQFVRGREQIG